MSVLCLTQGYHVVYMCLNVIFQILLLCSRSMTSYHVTCHVTTVSHASSLSKIKRKEKQNWYEIRKIKDKKIKIVSVQSISLSRMKEVDLVFFYFPFSFLFSFRFIFHYSIFRTSVRVRVTRSCCHTAGHIRWHGHKSHDTWKEVEDSGRMMSYNIWNKCWP